MFARASSKFLICPPRDPQLVPNKTGPSNSDLQLRVAKLTLILSYIAISGLYGYLSSHSPRSRVGLYENFKRSTQFYRDNMPWQIKVTLWTTCRCSILKHNLPKQGPVLCSGSGNLALLRGREEQTTRPPFLKRLGVSSGTQTRIPTTVACTDS